MAVAPLQVSPRGADMRRAGPGANFQPGHAALPHHMCFVPLRNHHMFSLWRCRCRRVALTRAVAGLEDVVSLDTLFYHGTFMSLCRTGCHRLALTRAVPSLEQVSSLDTLFCRRMSV